MLKSSLFIAILLSFFVILLEAEPYKVILGKDAVFEICNTADPDLYMKKLKGNPAVWAKSRWNLARAAVYSNSYSEGVARANASIDFSVDCADPHLKVTALIVFTYTYELDVKFDVLPPGQGGGGSADTHARAFYFHNGNRYDFDFKNDHITFIHYKNAAKKKKVKSVVASVSLKKGDEFEIIAQTYAHADVYKGNFAHAIGNIRVLSLQVLFGKPKWYLGDSQNEDPHGVKFPVHIFTLPPYARPAGPSRRAMNGIINYFSNMIGGRVKQITLNVYTDCTKNNVYHAFLGMQSDDIIFRFGLWPGKNDQESGNANWKYEYGSIRTESLEAFPNRKFKKWSFLLTQSVALEILREVKLDINTNVDMPNSRADWSIHNNDTAYVKYYSNVYANLRIPSTVVNPKLLEKYLEEQYNQNYRGTEE